MEEEEEDKIINKVLGRGSGGELRWREISMEGLKGKRIKENKGNKTISE